MGNAESTHVTREHTAPLLQGVDAERMSRQLDAGTGLTSEEVAARLARYGFNEVQSKKTSPLMKLALKFWGPMPFPGSKTMPNSQISNKSAYPHLLSFWELNFAEIYGFSCSTKNVSNRIMGLQ